MSRRAVEVRGKAYSWAAGEGLDPAAVLELGPWITACARAYLRSAAERGMGLEDLAQAGALGALKAARSYDPDKGKTYLSWATRRIRDEMAALCRRPAHQSLDEGGAEAADGGAPDPDKAIEAAQAMKGLPLRERGLLAAHFGIGTGCAATNAVLAGRMGLSPGRVNQLLNQALSRARRRVTRNGR